jgi:hypothetical protein
VGDVQNMCGQFWSSKSGRVEIRTLELPTRRLVIELFQISCVIIQCVRKVAVHLQKVLEVMSTSVYTGLNPFNFIRKHFLQTCVRKADDSLREVLEVMSTSVYTGLKPFNFILLRAQRLSERTV